MEDYITSYVSFCAKVRGESNLKSRSDQLPIYRKYKGHVNTAAKGYNYQNLDCGKLQYKPNFFNKLQDKKEEMENSQTKRTINQMQHVDLTRQVETASNQANEVNVHL